MPLTLIHLNTKYLSLYVETDKGILFHHAQQSLYQLPPASIALLLALDEGFSQQKAISEVAQNSLLSKEQLLPFCQQIKALFTQKKTELSYLDGRYPELASVPNKITAPLQNTLSYQIADATFAISTQSSLLMSEISQLLAPCAQVLAEVDFVLSIQQGSDSSADTFNIYSNGQLIEDGLSFNQVLPTLIDRLQILAFQKSDYHFCYHGAALQTPHGNLLLPGKSGAGKSTLSATLADCDNKLYSDEIIALNKNFQLTILNLPIAIKSGSWTLLSKQYPELKDARIWHRLDGRLLKYVWPPSFAQKTNRQTSPKTKNLLVNPHFVETDNDPLSTQQSPRTAKLSTIETIAMLTESGYQLGIELTQDKLEQLIGFIERTPCHRLSYSSTKQALQQLALLWQTR